MPLKTPPKARAAVGSAASFAVWTLTLPAPGAREAHADAHARLDAIRRDSGRAEHPVVRAAERGREARVAGAHVSAAAGCVAVGAAQKTQPIVLRHQGTGGNGARGRRLVAL